jgi:hypothetical protein
MTKYFGILFSVLLIGMQSHARWTCQVECKRSFDTVFYKIDRHASGTAYSDFNAECQAASGTSTFPGQSGCTYVYCKKFSSITQILSGTGETLTLARQDARARCPQGGTDSCGLMDFNSIGEYTCTQE